MKIFRFNKKDKKKKFRITEPDREWVEDNFKWLIKIYGYPSRKSGQFVIDKKFLPKTFSTDEIVIQNLVEDLSCWLSLESAKIKFEIHEDLRDTYGMPFVLEGNLFETETEILEKNYRIHIAKSITQRPNRLIYSLIYEFIQIRLIESELEFNTGDDTSLFIFIAGIYFGFGIVLSQNLVDRGKVNDGFWETKWNYVSEMPNEVMAFGLAVYSMLIQESNFDWKNELPEDVKMNFEGAIELLHDSPPSMFDKAELEASTLMHKAMEEEQTGNYDLAISTLQKILFLTKDELFKAEIFNNIGYIKLKTGNIESSIADFRKALQLEPNFGFAYDNLGYALIQNGYIEEGKKELEKAIKTNNNDLAYSYRNLALYYLANKEYEKAKSNFLLAFETETVPVDLLEFHYANYLLEHGETKEGMIYLQKAVEKDEAEAIKRMSELKNSLS